jgi:hypothetical protein
MNVTIKQVLIGTVVGSSIVGIMVHRLHQTKNFTARPKLAMAKLAQQKDHSHKTVSLPKHSHSGKQPANTETEVSFSKLYGG